MYYISSIFFRVPTEANTRERLVFAVNALVERFIKRRCSSLKRDASRRERAMPIFGIDPSDALSFVGKYGQKL